jgi:hypothetical protein
VNIPVQKKKQTNKQTKTREGQCAIGDFMYQLVFTQEECYLVKRVA